MFTTSAAKNRDVLFLNGIHDYSLKKVHVQYRNFRSKRASLKPTDAINRLITAYLFRDFNQQCLNSDGEQAVLEQLKSPYYRAKTIQPASPLLRTLLRNQHLFTDTAQLLEQTSIDAETKLLAVSLANHSPFTHQTSWFNHFDDLHTLAVDELLALLCATCFYKQCITNESTAAEINLFYQGVCSGFINMQIAYKYGFNPLHCFLTPLIHHFSLVIIYRELNQQTQLPNAKCVLNEIDQIHLKLGYWIAKDWGLSDDILYPLRERFLREESSLLCELIQKSEHAYIAIQFCHQNLLTRKETLALLKVMQLEEYDFFAQLASTH